MSKYFLALVIISLFSSCYTYKTYDPKDELTSTDNPIENTKLTSVRGVRNQNSANSNSVNQNPVNVDLENVSVKTIIKDKGYYQLEVFEKDYKIEAVKWEGDSLIAHKKGQPKVEYKFNEKDIQNLKVRKFSKSRSDALTVAAYVMGGVAVFLLVK